MKAIIVTQIQFNELNDRVQQYCIENIQGYNATKWADEKIHPQTGEIAFTVEDKILSALTQAETNGIVELTQNWFPIEKL